MVSMHAAKPPVWHTEEEEAEHLNYMLRYKVVPCTEYRLGNCCASNCFEYHEDGEMRRPVVGGEGNLLYWDQMCEYIDNQQQCPFGYGCPFAHTAAEREYHPGQYLCQDGPYKVHARPQARLYTYPFANQEPSVVKYRFCAHYPNVENCRRREFCAFAHCRSELTVPLLSLAEEQKSTLSNDFFTKKFKIYWCPIGVQHDWQTCVYAHNYQDARRNPDIGYGPKPCPYWEKKQRLPGYEKRCPHGFACPYSHGAKEQLYHPLYFKTVVCWDFSQSKTCPRGDLCAFYHARKLQRTPPEDQTDYNVALTTPAMQQLQPYFRNPPAFTPDEKKGNWEVQRGYEMYDSPAAVGIVTPLFICSPQSDSSPVFFLPPSPMHGSQKSLTLTPVNSGLLPSPYDSQEAHCLFDNDGLPQLNLSTPCFPFPDECWAGEGEEKPGQPTLHLRMNSHTTTGSTSNNSNNTLSDSDAELGFCQIPPQPWVEEDTVVAT